MKRRSLRWHAAEAIFQLSSLCLILSRLFESASGYLNQASARLYAAAIWKWREVRVMVDPCSADFDFVLCRTRFRWWAERQAKKCRKRHNEWRVLVVDMEPR